MQVFTTEPGVQFYTGGFLDGSYAGKGDVVCCSQHVHMSIEITPLFKVVNKFGGFCLETQHYPDSPNQPTFPSTLLRPGDTYSSKTIYKFGVE